MLIQPPVSLYSEPHFRSIQAEFLLFPLRFQSLFTCSCEFFDLLAGSRLFLVQQEQHKSEAV